MLWCKPITISVTMLSSVDSKHEYSFNAANYCMLFLVDSKHEYKGIPMMLKIAIFCKKQTWIQQALQYKYYLQ